MSYPWSDGNVLYAADLNNSVGNTQPSGTGHIGSYMSASWVGMSTFSAGSQEIGTYTGSGVFTGIVQSFADTSPSVQLNVKIEVDGYSFWSGTVPMIIGGLTNSESNYKHMGMMIFNQKFNSELKAYAYLTANGSSTFQYINIDFVCD